jgi:tRNA-dihydrouridine synthase
MANWDYRAEVKNNPKINIPIFGNGDIDSPEKAVEYKKKYGVDGIMIGRAAIGNPWIFDEIKYYLKHNKKKSPPSIDERILAVKKHLDFSIKWKGEKLGLVEMRRHYNNYFKGIDNFKEFRMKLVLSENISSSLETLEEISSIYNTKKETSIT